MWNDGSCGREQTVKYVTVMLRRALVLVMGRLVAVREGGQGYGGRQRTEVLLELTLNRKKGYRNSF